MKKREPRTYISDRGVETYVYGVEFEQEDFKVGDIVKVYDVSYSLNYAYPNRDRFMVSRIKKIDWEKGIITLENGLNYKQDKSTSYFYPGKEVEYLNRFKITKDTSIKDTVYSNSSQMCENAFIRPRYLVPYSEQEFESLKAHIQEESLKREELRKAEDAKKSIYNKYQALYDDELNPLREQIKELEKQLAIKCRETFDKVFCANCKTGCDKRCAYEKYMGYYPDKNGMIEVCGEKCRSRKVSKCEFFEEK